MAKSKSPEEKIAERIAQMQADMASPALRATLIDHGVWKADYSAEIAERSAERSADAAFARKVAGAARAAMATETERATLRAGALALKDAPADDTAADAPAADATAVQ
jgi:hypothetical protein